MARVPSRPLTGVCISVLLAGCQAGGDFDPKMNMAFAAPGAVTQLAMQFSTAADPKTVFAAGSFTLDDAARANLRAQAAWLIANPGAKVRLIAGGETGENHLAAMRVRAVEAVLIEAGVDRSRIRLAIAGEIGLEGKKRLAGIVLSEVAAPRTTAQLAGAAPVPVAAEQVTPPVTAAPPSSTPTADVEGDPEPQPTERPRRMNAGKGNGDDGGDPGNSGLHNRAGDD